MKKVDKKTLLPVMALVALTSVVLVGVLLYFVIMVSTLIPYDAYNDHPIANVIFVIILALILIGGFVFDIIAVAKTGEDVRASWKQRSLGNITHRNYHIRSILRTLYPLGGLQQILVRGCSMSFVLFPVQT